MDSKRGQDSQSRDSGSSRNFKLETKYKSVIGIRMEHESGRGSSDDSVISVEPNFQQSTLSPYSHQKKPSETNYSFSDRAYHGSRLTFASDPTQATKPPPPKIQFLSPGNFPLGRLDSTVTITSTVARKLSNASMRGSMMSTHLSDMPSTYSQAFFDPEPSMVGLATPQTQQLQQLDISPTSAANFRKKWLEDFLRGYVPKDSFTIRITNLLTRKSVDLRVCKNYTVNQICHLYMQYDDHPEYYLWRDINGKILEPTKTLVEVSSQVVKAVLYFKNDFRFISKLSFCFV